MSNEELVQSYQSGDKEALNKLVELNEGIVYKIANKFYVEKSNSIDIDDLIQEGFVGLILAADKYRFDIENPCKFSTYAVYWIYQKMNRFVNTKNTNEESSLNTPIGDNGDNELLDYIEGIDYSFENVEEKIYNQELRKEIELVMYETLTLREREILKLRHGWDNNKCMKRDEIADLFNDNKEHIRYIENAAYGKMRRTPWGANKAEEFYNERINKSRFNADNALDVIGFADKYLSI